MAAQNTESELVNLIESDKAVPRPKTFQVPSKSRSSRAPLVIGLAIVVLLLTLNVWAVYVYMTVSSKWVIIEQSFGYIQEIMTHVNASTHVDILQGAHRMAGDPKNVRLAIDLLYTLNRMFPP